MDSSHQQALIALVSFIALIIVAILAPFALKALRRRNNLSARPVELDQQPDLPSAQLGEALPDPLVTESPKEFQRALDSAEVESQNLRKALRHTEENIFGRLRGLFSSTRPPVLDEIEEVL